MTREAHQTQDPVAASWFAGIMTLAAGGAGLVIAGLILGFDYVLHGEPHERQALAAKRLQDSRDRYADALAWLEADRTDRARHRKAVRDWFDADPAVRGDRPSSGEDIGRFFGRLWNNLLVGGTRFRNGWTDGRAGARRRREAGDPNWWKPEPRPSRPGPHAGQPGPAQPPPSPQPTPAPAPVVDAEIVPDDEAGPRRDVVPVGADEPAGTDPAMGGYRQRLDELANEVGQVRDTRTDDPSPPLSALR